MSHLFDRSSYSTGSRGYYANQDTLLAAVNGQRNMFAGLISSAGADTVATGPRFITNSGPDSNMIVLAGNANKNLLGNGLGKKRGGVDSRPICAQS